MPQKDFDIDSLAVYLHLTPVQVSRMADRGKLPGRRIGGEWRFSHAEIHHWLEERIGVADEGQLADVQNVLDRAGDDQEPELSIAELLPLEAIAVPLAARTKSSVITRISDLAAETGLLWDSAKMAEAVRARENLHPTALDIGVALLHPRRPMPTILAQAFLALGCTSQPIPFGGAGGGLTDIFFLICSTNDRDHLRILARLSQILADGALLDGLRTADDPEQAHQAVMEAESSLWGGH